jgi:hypothetical protein
MSGIGAGPPGEWQAAQCDLRIGSTSRENVAAVAGVSRETGCALVTAASTSAAVH